LQDAILLQPARRAVPVNAWEVTAYVMDPVKRVLVQLRPVVIAAARVPVVYIVVLPGVVEAAAAVRQSIVAADCTSATADVTRHVPRVHSLAAHQPVVFVIRLAAKG
jgi:hypothetical protein